MAAFAMHPDLAPRTARAARLLARAGAGRRAARPARAADARGRSRRVAGAARGAAGRAARARDRRPAAGVGRSSPNSPRAARARGIRLHMDGARLWEAREAYAPRTHAEICALFDSVYVSFYKGIGALAGAALAGSTHVHRAGARVAQAHGRHAGAAASACRVGGDALRCAAREDAGVARARRRAGGGAGAVPRRARRCRTRRRSTCSTCTSRRRRRRWRRRAMRSPSAKACGSRPLRAGRHARSVVARALRRRYACRALPADARSPAGSRAWCRPRKHAP